jgi:putative YhbY family RNA-binding protein
MLAHPCPAGLAAAHFLTALLQLHPVDKFKIKPLSPAERSLLKAKAHALRPVVIVGSKSLTESVLKEIETSLKAHELIKIRVAGDDRELRGTLLDEICARTGASPVQHIGKVLVVYREKPQPPSAPEKHPARKQPRRTKQSYQND